MSRTQRWTRNDSFDNKSIDVDAIRRAATGLVVLQQCCMSISPGSAPMLCEKALQVCRKVKLARAACLRQNRMPGSGCTVVDNGTSHHRKLGISLSEHYTKSEDWQLPKVSVKDYTGKACYFLCLGLDTFCSEADPQQMSRLHMLLQLIRFTIVSPAGDDVDELVCHRQSRIQYPNCRQECMVMVLFLSLSKSKKKKQKNRNIHQSA